MNLPHATKPNGWRLLVWMHEPQTLAVILPELTRQLSEASETARLDAQRLAAHLLNQSRAWILAHPETRLTPGQQAQLEALAERLAAGEPLPYLLGEWEFYGRSFWVSPAVLIPRPETELLVETALKWLALSLNPRVVDVGAGSGCIAISIAAERADACLIGIDSCAAALHIAAQNARRHQVAQKTQWLQADLLTAFIPGKRFDLICANLPYIPSQTLAGLKVALGEPHLALDGGQDGLALIRQILAQARGLLAPGGGILMEIEASQGASVIQLAQAHFPQAQIQLHQDLAGLDRLVAIKIPAQVS